MPKTREWAASHGLCVLDSVPPVSDWNEPYKRDPEEVALRTIILHCVAAVGYHVDPAPIIEWMQDQDIWNATSPSEKDFLQSSQPSDEDRSNARWRQEAQWALLWSVGKVKSLGLPTCMCDTARLVDEIMPGLGAPIDLFVRSADLRPPSELLGEDDRIYNLHCYARKACATNSMPDDLVYEVLFQRHYAFEWLNGESAWDDVRTDT